MKTSSSTAPFLLLLLLLSFLSLVAAAPKKLPPTFKRCSISSANVNECLAEAVEDAIKQLANGAKELKIPSLEPLLIPSLSIGQGQGPVRVQQDYKNVEIHGLTQSKVTKYLANFDLMEFHVDSLSPRLELIADYQMRGNLLLFPINGKGKCNVTLTNVKLHHKLSGKKEMKNGKEYLNLTGYTVSIDPERVHYDYSNLFEGDQQLALMLNNVFNENWKEIYEDVRSGYEQSFGFIFLQLGQMLFKRVPFYDVYLP